MHLLVFILAGADARVGPQLRALETFRRPAARPELRERAENSLLHRGLSAKQRRRQVRLQHDPRSAGQDQEGRRAVVALARDDFPLAIAPDAGVVP